MKFGAFFLLQSPAREPTKKVYSQALDDMAYAEELGFDSIWLAEHHFSNYGYSPNPLMLAVKAAQVTSKVRIGTAVLVLPLWNPIRVAEDIAMADVLTDGRLEVGIGRGYQVHEFKAFGTGLEQSRQMYEESVDIILKALTSRTFSHKGAHYKILDIPIPPSPTQNPPPPIWVAAQSPDSVVSTGAHGFNLFTSGAGRPMDVLIQVGQSFREAAQKAGHTHPVEFSVQNQIYIVEKEQEAWDAAEHHRWQFRMANQLRSGTLKIHKGVAYPEASEGEPPLQDFVKGRSISGTPDQVIPMIKRYRDEIGITQLNCSFSVGSLDHDKAKKSMTLFAKHVMPRFR